jgi:soluble epoxide hydrolase / lipid-phosphate phosphatase
MLHGWPGLWSNWGQQILEFQNEYHIIAVDHRGFGASTHPDDVESSGTMGDIVGDAACVLEHAGVEEAICLG